MEPMNAAKLQNESQPLRAVAGCESRSRRWFNELPLERSFAVYLENGFARRPGEMWNPSGYDREVARVQLAACALFESLSDPEMDGAGNDRDALGNRMRVRRDLIAGWHFQPHCE